MSWLQRIFRPKLQKEQTNLSAHAKKRSSLPVIQFDSSLVTKKVSADLRNNVEQLSDISKRNRRDVYDAALAMIESGGNMALLSDLLQQQDEISKGRAGEIARRLLSRARALIQQEKQVRLGITHATWMYANAPCMLNPSNPTEADRKQDAAHRAANGKRFDVVKGLQINGLWTLPGRGDGCNCFSKSLLPGL